MGNLAGSFFNGAGAFVQAFMTVRASRPLWEKFEALEETLEEGETLDAIPAITLENVSFAYADRSVLHNQNALFAAGGKYAVMGESGSGKSTMVKIILGLLPGYSGAVRYGHQEQKSINPECLFRHIAYVDQQVYLFQDTLRFNITLGEPYPEEEIMAVIRRCKLEKLVDSLPQGLDSVIAENGKNLSGGQRQGIALARGLIRKASYLILNEGTSALDEGNAEEIENMLMKETELGVVIITHHLRENLRPKLTGIYSLGSLRTAFFAFVRLFRHPPRLTACSSLKYNIRYCAEVCPSAWNAERRRRNLQTVALKPKRAEWTAMLIGMVLLCAAMIAVPALCVPLSLAVPLLACPMVGRREEPAAWASAVVPVVASLLKGYDPLYAASLLLIGALPLLITRLVPMKQRPGPKGILMYLSAIAFSLTVVLAMAVRMLGGPLQYTLAEAFTEWVAQSPHKQMLLQQLAINGLISVPEGYTAQGLTGVLMEASYSREMLMSLRLTAERLIAQELPSLFVQSCMIVGLFIPLRLERVNGVLLVVETRTASDKQTRVIAPPSFRLLAMPRSIRITAFALAMAAFLLLMVADSFSYTLGQLCYAALETMFCLLGAAVMVFVYTKNDPDRKTMAGVLAAALYVLAPFVLFVIGLADQTFHFRNP